MPRSACAPSPAGAGPVFRAPARHKTDGGLQARVGLFTVQVLQQVVHHAVIVEPAQHVDHVLHADLARRPGLQRQFHRHQHRVQAGRHDDYQMLMDEIERVLSFQVDQGIDVWWEPLLAIHRRYAGFKANVDFMVIVEVRGFEIEALRRKLAGQEFLRERRALVRQPGLFTDEHDIADPCLQSHNQKHQL